MSSRGTKCSVLKEFQEVFFKGTKSYRSLRLR